jgi:uncharacterized protein
MTLEMLDGFLTALVIGPAMVMPSEYLRVIWGTDDDDGPLWDSVAQAQYFMNLLTKHWNAIAARRDADAPHDPFIDTFGHAEQGHVWAKGFVVGIELSRSGWEPMLKDRHAVEMCNLIFALMQDDPQYSGDRITSKMREEIVDRLPVTLQSIAAYWRTRTGHCRSASSSCDQRRLDAMTPVPAVQAGNSKSAAEVPRCRHYTDARTEGFGWYSGCAGHADGGRGRRGLMTRPTSMRTARRLLQGGGADAAAGAQLCYRAESTGTDGHGHDSR